MAGQGTLGAKARPSSFGLTVNHIAVKGVLGNAISWIRYRKQCACYKITRLGSYLAVHGAFVAPDSLRVRLIVGEETSAITAQQNMREGHFMQNSGQVCQEGRLTLVPVIIHDTVAAQRGLFDVQTAQVGSRRFLNFAHDVAS